MGLQEHIDIDVLNIIGGVHPYPSQLSKRSDAVDLNHICQPTPWNLQGLKSKTTTKSFLVVTNKIFSCNAFADDLW